MTRFSAARRTAEGARSGVAGGRARMPAGRPHIYRALVAICDRIATVRCQFRYVECSMSLQSPARPRSLTWSNPVAWWWGLLTLVGGVNITVWLLLYRYFQEPSIGDANGTS